VHRTTKDAKLAYPIQEAFGLIGVSPTKGYELIKPGTNGEPAKIQTFLIGRRRYAIAESVQAFIRACFKETQNESPADRVSKVQKALTGRAVQRAREKAA